MNIDWQDPRAVSLHERLAAVAQREYEDSLTHTGSVADAEYLGARTATEILTAAVRAEFDANGWTLTFYPDPDPSQSRVIFCATCNTGEGQLHLNFCHRRGVLRQDDTVTL